MTIWQFRNTLDLEILYKSGTISCTIYRNQEIYSKFDSLIRAGVDPIEAKRRLTNYGICRRMINYILKELEKEI